MEEYILPNDERKKTLIQLKNVLLILLIVIDLMFIISITFFEIDVEDLVFMAYFDLLVCFILFLNLLDMYRRSDVSPLKFIRTHIIDIISIIPFNFIFLRYLAVFRIFRILQFFQIIKVFNIKEINVHSLKYFIQNQLLKVITLILLVYIIVSSLVLFFVDNSFYSVFDSVWYTLVTVTGVGYGDITPVTYSGKVIGMLTIILGVFFISIFTAAMSGLYMEKNEEETRAKLKHQIEKLEDENKVLNKQVNSLQQTIVKMDEKLDKILEKE